ncbi:MAG: lipase family protein [Acidimicrobiales bacterium]|jgi:pimeloyl-ACP methyl ester carboxylesterase|nr:lipase family protein [Acidimicrobiales bacterium]
MTTGRARALLLAVVLVVTATTGACGGDRPAPDAAASTTRVTGVVVSTTPLETDRGRAWQLDYTSTGEQGQPITARAVLFTPEGTPPPDGWPLVVYGHGTTGLADRCAPSNQGVGAIVARDALLERGWAMVAPDFEGLGVEGPHPYLAGRSAAHTMLDAAVAAGRVPGSGVRNASPVVLWGFSQGGQAAAFAAELAPTYAPDLALRGAALNSPVTDVASFLEDAAGAPDRRAVVVAAIDGYARSYAGLDRDDVLTPQAIEDLDVFDTACISGAILAFAKPVDELLVTEPWDEPAWVERFGHNTPGGTAVAVPVVLMWGTDDTVVDPADLDELAERWCRTGAAVERVDWDNAGHLLYEDELVAWTAQRLDGEPPGDSCARQET